MFRALLDLARTGPLKPAAIVRSPRWKKVEPLMKSYLGNTLHLLGMRWWWWWLFEGRGKGGEGRGGDRRGREEGARENGVSCGRREMS